MPDKDCGEQYQENCKQPWKGCMKEDQTAAKEAGCCTNKGKDDKRRGFKVTGRFQVSCSKQDTDHVVQKEYYEACSEMNLGNRNIIGYAQRQK